MRVVILFSATGGGHRAAAMAIRTAITEERSDVEVVLRDGLVEGGPWPLNRAPAIYEWGMRHARWAWGALFYLWNGRMRARLMADLGYPATARRLRRLIAAEKPDVLVSTHPLLTRSVARSLKKLGNPCPFAIVVTDLVSGHLSWYEAAADRILLPTPEAFENARGVGIPEERLRVTGQAVHPRCVEARDRRDELRTRFGWKGIVVLLVGGGEGMGRLDRYARAIDAAALDVRLVVVCGRNTALKDELSRETWRGTVEVHGFVDNLHELMAAADVLVTKGGPGSIMEGCVAGLPLLVYDYLPGQEAGNIRLVEERGIGHYVPRPADLVEALRHWLDDPASRLDAAARSRAAAIPDSARQIALAILSLAPTPSGHRHAPA